MRLLLFRHGETAHNAGGLVQGQADIPLNDWGRRQAQAAAEGVRAEPIVAVYASPLQRARDTAAAIAAVHGLLVTIEPDVIEMNVGAMEGLSGLEMRERFPQFMTDWAGPNGPFLPMPAGESLEQVQARAWGAIERLLERHPAETVALVTHNFVLACLVCKALNLPLPGFRRFRHGIACRTVLELSPDRILVRSLNDSCHLDALALDP